jgi:Arc/MetJ-type ribon-helix-helix transcriptional regulator
MKIKVSISMDEYTMKKVEETIKDGSFRNKSHFIEVATQRQLDKRLDESKLKGVKNG